MTTPADARGGTIPEVIQHWGETYPDKEVFVFYSDAGRRFLTCGRLHLLARKFAAFLQRIGLRKGDIVCTTLTNSAERLVTDFGIITAGCVTATAQAVLTDGTDLLHVINLSKCRLLLVDPTLKGGAWDLLKNHLGDVKNGRVQTDKAPSLEMVHFVCIAKDEQFLETLIQETEPDVVEIRPTDRALCWATSGSTGFSKLVPHTHERLLLMALTFKEIFRVGTDDIFYSDRPLGWAGGWPYPFIGGCNTQVLTDTRGTVRDPCKLTWNAIDREGCTLSLLTMTFVKTLCKRNDLVKAPLLKKMIITGSPFRAHLVEVVHKLCNVVVASYGLTEMGYITTANCSEKAHFIDNLAGSISERVEVKIVDDQLQEVATGKDGEILIKGPIVFTEYLNSRETTRATLTEDGWMKTNDRGHFDEMGQLFVEGRRSDAIMHGEYIIYPSWVEKKLSECPFVDQVMVIGIPDGDSFDVCACVIPTDSGVTSAMIRDYCDPMFLVDSLHEISARPGHYVLMNEFPLRPTGKPDRRALVELAMKRLNL